MLYKTYKKLFWLSLKYGQIKSAYYFKKLYEKEEIKNEIKKNSLTKQK